MFVVFVCLFGRCSSGFSFLCPASSLVPLSCCLLCHSVSLSPSLPLLLSISVMLSLSLSLSLFSCFSLFLSLLSCSLLLCQPLSVSIFFAAASSLGSCAHVPRRLPQAQHKVSSCNFPRILCSASEAGERRIGGGSRR